MKVLKRVKKLKDFIAVKKAEKGAYKKQIKSLEKDILKMQEEQEIIDRANVALQYIIEYKQQSIINTFEETVTSALHEIFGENYSFKLQFNKRNKMSTVDFTIHTGEYKGYLPLKMCHGKAIKETIAVVLRVIFISMLEGRRILVLDESFGGIEIDREYQVGQFLNKVCDKFNIQLIMVSHKAGIGDSADNKVKI